MIRIRISKLPLPYKILAALFPLLFGAAFAQEQELSILFTGDVMQHGPQIEGAYNAKTARYDYDEGFKFIQPVVAEADIAVANLEVTHAGKPYKGYPQFSAPDELSQTLKDVGFDILLTANNHTCDGRAKGFRRTLDVLDEVGIRHTGTFRNPEERAKNYPLMIEQKGLRIALLNYTYGTNGLTVPAPLIVNYIDSAVIAKDVQRAKELKADYIICAMHWGVEYKSLPNNYQKNYEQYCYELGVDMIMGGHPHVLQPIEKKTVEGTERITAWSMGNFVSNQRARYKNGGIMITTDLHIRDHAVTATDVSYVLTWVHPRNYGDLKPYYILPDFDYDAYDAFLDPGDTVLMQQYFSDSRELFAAHNSGTHETLLSETAGPGKELAYLVNGFYAVQVGPETTDPSPDFMKQGYGRFVHRYLLANGNYVYLSEMTGAPDLLPGHIRFLQDCGLTVPLTVVWMSASGTVNELP